MSSPFHKDLPADPVLYTSKPTADRKAWMVFDMYEDLPPKPIFVGTMEECEWVRDSKNGHLAVEGR